MSEFSLDPDNAQLWRNDQVITLPPKTFSLLCYLVERSGQLVSKEELLEAVWPNAYVVEESVKHYVAEIRRALDDDPQNPIFIETVRGRGYRFIGTIEICKHNSSRTISTDAAPVDETDVEAPVTLPDSSPPKITGKMLPKNVAESFGAEQPTRSSNPRYNARFILSIAALSGLLALIVVWWEFEHTTVENAASTPPDMDMDITTSGPSIAVLPFTNISADPDQEYFADGLTEDLITDLSKLSNLLVIARNSVFTYKDRAVDIQKVATELGVRYLLEGSVRKAGDRIRINAQLIDATTRGHLWAERYDRKLTDIFDVQDEINEEIISALALKLTGQEKRLLAQHVTNNLEAYDFFQQGRRFIRTTSPERGREMLRQALQLDPEFARAYGVLAVSHTLTVQFGRSENIASDLDNAFTLASKAVVLDRELPQAHWALSYMFLFRKQHERALAAVEQAIRLDPNYADGYGLLAFIKLLLGDVEAALESVAKALRLDPIASSGMLNVVGLAYYSDHRFDEAIKVLKKAAERNSEDINSHVLLAANYQRIGHMDEAAWEVAEIMHLNPDFTINRWPWGPLYQDKNDSNRQRLLADLRQIGLPDN